MKNVKEITQIQVFHFKIQMGRLKSKYGWQIRAMTQEKRKRSFLRRSFWQRALKF